MSVSVADIDCCNVSYSDFSSICRLCLTTNQKSSRIIEQKDITLLNHIADIQISETDELPKTICINCIKSLDLIENFINGCKRSHKVLKSVLLENKKLEDEVIINIDCNHGRENFQIEHQEEHLDHIVPLVDIHETKATNSNVYCHNCKLIFKTKSELKTHYKDNRMCRPQKFKLYTCEFCSKEFLSLRGKLRHENFHRTQTKYNCSYIPKQLKSTLKQHTSRNELTHDILKSNVIRKDNRVQLKCQICGKIFSSRSGFQYHKERHEGKVLQKPCQFKRIKTAKTFLCNYCASSFYIKSNLMSHLRIHTGEKPFKCNYCSQEFRQKSSLNRHASSHADMERRLFLCNICQNNFTTKAHRDIHMRTHTGEKPYMCEFCQKRFTYRSQWRIHLRLHTGETPFACSVCNRTYHDKGSLRKHQKRKCHLEANLKSVKSKET